MALSVCESTLDDLLRLTYEAILSRGRTIEPSRGPAREVVGACLELTNPRSRLSRTESRRREVSPIAELCWYLSGTDMSGPITFYLSRYADDAEIDGTIHGAYGPRMFGDGGRIPDVITALRKNQDTRRAVVQIFDHADLGPKRYKDVPCTCTLQFLLRDGALHLVVNMRSNDAYSGLLHDVFAFTMLQELVARSVDAELGRYIHVVGSLHLYDDNAPAVAEYLQEGYQSTLAPMPAMPAGNPWPHVTATLAAEAQIRDAANKSKHIPFDQVSLPTESYWADLVRVLGAWVARRKFDAPVAAATVEAGIVHPVFREFV